MCQVFKTIALLIFTHSCAKSNGIKVGYFLVQSLRLFFFDNSPWDHSFKTYEFQMKYQNIITVFRHLVFHLGKRLTPKRILLPLLIKSLTNSTKLTRNLFSTLSVTQRSLVYLTIWSTLQNVSLEFHVFVFVLSFKLLALFIISIFVLISFLLKCW